MSGSLMRWSSTPRGSWLLDSEACQRIVGAVVELPPGGIGTQEGRRLGSRKNPNDRRPEMFLARARPLAPDPILPTG